MPADPSLDIRTFVLIISAISGASGLLGAWVVIPWRLRQLEDRVKELDSDHDLLVKLDERCKLILQTLDDLKALRISREERGWSTGGSK